MGRPLSSVFGVLALALTMGAWAAPAQAADLSLNAAVAAGNESSQAFDLYLKASFDPWWSGSSLSLRPQAQAGIGLWHKDSYTASKNQRHRSWAKNNFSIYGAVGLELAYTGWSACEPFAGLNLGLSYVDEKDFLGRELGSHILIFSRGDLGLRFGDNFRHSLSVQLTHYSNARTNKKNDGLNNVGLAYGFSF